MMREAPYNLPAELLLLEGSTKITIPRIDLRDRTAVHQSLQSFCTQYNEQGCPNASVEHRLKRNSTMPDGQFILTPVKTVYNSDDPEYEYVFGNGYMFMDAPHAMLLGYQQNKNETLWLAGLGFDSLRGRFTGRLLDAEPRVDGPYIIQIQAYIHLIFDKINSKNIRCREKQQEAGAILKRFHWEAVLVEALVNWAAHEQFPVVYGRPACMNAWVDDSQQEEEVFPYQRAYKHYDQSFAGLGFVQSRSYNSEDSDVGGGVFRLALLYNDGNNDRNAG